MINLLSNEANLASGQGPSSIPGALPGILSLRPPSSCTEPSGSEGSGYPPQSVWEGKGLSGSVAGDGGGGRGVGIPPASPDV